MVQSPKIYEVSATIRTNILAELVSGQSPSTGSYDSAQLKDLQAAGLKPQLGAVRYTPGSILAEFVYSDTQRGSQIFLVTIPSPERIVFMPIPSWVVHNIWQGELSGSYQFESHARQMVAEFEASLAAEPNVALFDQQSEFIRH